MLAPSSRQVGKNAEDIALNFLQDKGFSLIQQNFTISGGEIDLIMRDKSFIVFVEVKSLRENSPYSLYSSLTKTKKKFLLRAIDRWLLKNGLKDSAWRVD